MMLKTIACTLLIAFLASMAWPVSAVELGAEAPEFSFTDVRSLETVSLSDYRGKVVVLIFFFYY